MKTATRRKKDIQKLNVEVPKKKLTEIKAKLQYGQLTFIINTFLDEIHQRLQTDNFGEVLDWLYKDKKLTLKKGEES